MGLGAYASDAPSGVQFIEHSDGSPACCLTTASRAVTAVAGDATATLMAQADSLNGTLKEKASASVAASRFVIGRNSGGEVSAYMEGSINLIGPVPGLATFMGVLEGTYIVTPAPSNFQGAQNSIRVVYDFSVGSLTAHSPARPPFADRQYFFCCGTGTFSIPFTWTQLVNPGDPINFNLYLRTDVSAVAGIVDFDATNTFKITGIGLPQGYSFTSDATGFLSQFGAPTVPVDPPGTQIPEPGTLLLIGLAGMLAVAKRRPGSAKHLAGRAQHFQSFRLFVSPNPFTISRLSLGFPRLSCDLGSPLWRTATSRDHHERL